MRFYFAWLEDAFQDFSDTAHVVEDEQVFSWVLTQQEGEFATLEVEVRNPRVGFLAPGRLRWIWFSMEDDNGVVTPLFHGRLLGIPENIQEELVKMTFVARPGDYEEQKAALAETLKVTPFWDPVWIDENEIDNPDAVLEARPDIWHVGRTDKEVTISDILIGEDGTLEFDGTNILNLNLEIGQETLRKVRVEAKVDWRQVALGTLDLKAELIEIFRAAGSGKGLMSSYTGQGLEATWPLPGESIGGGWSFSETEIKLMSGDGINPRYWETGILPPGDPEADLAAIKGPPRLRKVGPGEWVPFETGAENWHRLPPPARRGIRGQRFVTLKDGRVMDRGRDKHNPWDTAWLNVRPTYSDPKQYARFHCWEFAAISFALAYEADRARTEELSFEVSADVQDVMVDSGAARVELVKIQSSSIGDFIDPVEGTDSLELPIGDIRRNSYFNLDRGKRSVEWLICLARTKLLASARAGQIVIDVPFEYGIDLSCRLSAIVTDDRLPGGQASGKIVHYTLSCNGDSGEMKTRITVACSIGKGNSLPAVVAGTPSYVVEGYVNTGYQFYTGATIAVVDDSISYPDFDQPIIDDGIDFFRMTAPRNVLLFQVVNGETAQEAILAQTYGAQQDAIDALNTAHTKVQIQMRPLSGGPFNTTFLVEPSALMVPKTLDLEAS